MTQEIKTRHQVATELFGHHDTDGELSDTILDGDVRIISSNECGHDLSKTDMVILLKAKGHFFPFQWTGDEGYTLLAATDNWDHAIAALGRAVREMTDNHFDAGIDEVVWMDTVWYQAIWNEMTDLGYIDREEWEV